jgi:hypothetical protein
MVSVDFRNSTESAGNFIDRIKGKLEDKIDKFKEDSTEEAIAEICKYLIIQSTRDDEVRKGLHVKFKTGVARAVEYQPMTLGNDYSWYTRKKYTDFGNDYVEAAWFVAACNLYVTHGEEISIWAKAGTIKVYFSENTFAEENPEIMEHLEKHAESITKKAKK